MFNQRPINVFRPQENLRTDAPEDGPVIQYTRLEALRMGIYERVEPEPDWPIQGAGRRLEGPNDWPGKYEGIRRPGVDETPLSWSEVRHWQSKDMT